VNRYDYNLTTDPGYSCEFDDSLVLDSTYDWIFQRLIDPMYLIELDDVGFPVNVYCPRGHFFDDVEVECKPEAYVCYLPGRFMTDGVFESSEGQHVSVLNSNFAPECIEMNNEDYNYVGNFTKDNQLHQVWSLRKYVFVFIPWRTAKLEALKLLYEPIKSRTFYNHVKEQNMSSLGSSR